MALEWQLISTITQFRGGMRSTGDTFIEISRACVPGGWLLLTAVKGEVDQASTSFYPDAEHLWDGNSLPDNVLHQHAAVTA
jgi:hypothetical protein